MHLLRQLRENRQFPLHLPPAGNDQKRTAEGILQRFLFSLPIGHLLFSELFVAYLVTRSNRIEEDLIDQLFNSSEKRLARLLLLLANFGKNGKPTPIDASLGLKAKEN